MNMTKSKSENMIAVREYLAAFEPDVIGAADLRLYTKPLIGIEERYANRYTFAVCFGFVLTQGVIDTVADGPTPLYLHHYRQLNYRLDTAAYLLAKRIEKEGFRALPFAASQVVDWQNQKGHVSHKHIGELAGLGWIGRNNLLINPRYGAMVRYNTVFTDMPLEANRPMEYGCGSCDACRQACPAQAIGTTPADFDHLGCFQMVKRFKNEKNLGHYICGICIEACRGQG